MKHKETEKVCIYCGKTSKGNGYMCSACSQKLPLVRELVAKGRMIKKGNKNNETSKIK